MFLSHMKSGGTKVISYLVALPPSAVSSASWYQTAVISQENTNVLKLAREKASFLRKLCVSCTHHLHLHSLDHNLVTRPCLVAR